MFTVSGRKYILRRPLTRLNGGMGEDFLKEVKLDVVDWLKVRSNGSN
jgi:hypothetical protein